MRFVISAGRFFIFKNAKKLFIAKRNFTVKYNVAYKKCLRLADY